MSRGNNKVTSVLVTRPVHQSAGFVSLLESENLRVVQLPSIEIEFTPVDLTESLHSDLIIFTSVNSATGAYRSLQQFHNAQWSSTAKIAAIGHVTAHSLKAFNISVDVVPDKGASTEALLEVIGDVSNRSVTIFRGDSGREALYNTLTTRGAIVRYQSVYKRSTPDYPKARLDALLQQGLPDIISVTSDLGLTNLLSILPPDLIPSLLDKPLVVNSTRCAQLAKSHGFVAEIKVADPAGDTAQLSQILSLR